MAARRLVVCLNPRHATGKLYALTDRGHRVVKQVFGIEVPRVPQGVDWRKCAQPLSGPASGGSFARDIRGALNPPPTEMAPHASRGVTPKQ